MPITVEHIYAARHLLLSERPFLAPFLLLCHVHVVDGNQVFCDRNWQIYFGQDWPAGKSRATKIGHLAVALYHELLHLVQNHFSRGQHLAGLDPHNWLLGCELEINDDILAEVNWEKKNGNGRLRMPKGAVIPQALELPVSLSAEEYWVILRQRSMNESGWSSCSSRSERQGEQSGRENQVRSSLRACCGGGSGTGVPAHRQEMRCAGQHSAIPDKTEQATAIRQFSEQACAYYRDRTPGSQPGWLQRLSIQEVRSEPAPWYRVLARYLSDQFRGSGQDDYSWRRPNRRNPFPDEIILPGAVARQPGDLGLLVDTSASMGQTDLNQAFGIIKGILQHLCAASDLTVHLIGCDTTAKYAGRIRSPRQLAELDLPRGGGTDMRVGIRLAEQLSPRVLVILTDGHTPWPLTPPRFPVIVVLIGAEAKPAPPWAMNISASATESVS